MGTLTATEIMSIPLINQTAPDFVVETTRGTIRFHEWIADGWAVLFSHPKDFTPTCTTELDAMAKLDHEFAKRNTKIIGLTVDTVSDHERWALQETQGARLNYPMIGDPQLKVAKLYGMLPADSAKRSAESTAVHNTTMRTVFVIGPDKKVKLQLGYPTSSDRNFDEVLRVLDSLQLVAKFQVSTPANWKPWEEVGAISPEHLGKAS